jgi:hypothetical protein
MTRTLAIALVALTTALGTMTPTRAADLLRTRTYSVCSEYISWRKPKGFRCASPLAARRLNEGKILTTKSLTFVCHGDSQITCNWYPGVERFESCGGNVHGANPVVTAGFLCGPGREYSAEVVETGYNGGYCGFAWFNLRCYQ